MLNEYLTRIRRDLHRIPELSFKEQKTAAYIIRELEKLNIPYVYGGLGGGIVARLSCKKIGAPTIALRAEMDALSGIENTNLTFSSAHEGEVHACGHDAHMAMLLGGAKLLLEKPLSINVLLVFQPAEENGGGAREIIKTGVFEDITAIFAGHVTHHYCVGQIMIGYGIITAQSDRFEINIKGKGGHGARPHEACDSIVIAAALINTIQTLVSREVDPLHPSVITIGELHAGSAPNVIAEDAVMKGSIRTTQDASRKKIHSGLVRIAAAFSDLYGAQVSVKITPGYPPVINTDKEVELAKQAALEVVGENGVKLMDYPSMGSEDFAYYLDEVPGCYVRFGARTAEQQFLPLHSPAFDINEKVLPIGANYFYQLAIQAEKTYGLF